MQQFPRTRCDYKRGACFLKSEVFTRLDRSPCQFKPTFMFSCERRKTSHLKLYILKMFQFFGADFLVVSDTWEMDACTVTNNYLDLELTLEPGIIPEVVLLGHISVWRASPMLAGRAWTPCLSVNSAQLQESTITTTLEIKPFLFLSR